MTTELSELSHLTGEVRLAIEVIRQAYEDANEEYDTYERNSARHFLMGYPSYYKERLELFCEMCGANSNEIIRQARKLWGKHIFKEK